MNRSASCSQRTGQPKCVQLTENAMKSASFTRRSQSAVLAVMPAHGSGDGSVTVTVTVLPTSKSAILPTEIHLPVVLRKIGATTKPTSGIPRMAAHTPLSPIQSFSRNRRRVISSSESFRGSGVESLAVTSFTENFVDPASKRRREKTDTHNQNYP